MNQKRFAKRMAVAAAFFFLCAGPGLTRAQNTWPYATRTDLFAGLTFTADQKAKIDEIHKNAKSRIDVVSKDANLDAEQKEAMLNGYRRMENEKVFKILTPEQRDAVREKLRAEQLAQREEKKKKQSLPK